MSQEPQATRSTPAVPSQSCSVPTAPPTAPPPIVHPKLGRSTSLNVPPTTRDRHRSDESLCGANFDSHSNRKRHASNESQRKRSKRRSRKSSGRPSEYDKALAGFQIWEPLKTQWDATTKQKKQVFETKGDEEDISSTVPVVTTPNQNVVDIDLSDTTTNKYNFLNDRFGPITITEKKASSSDYTLVISVQGYQFEGVSGSHEDALQDASSKALLLSPYLFTCLQ